MAETLTGDRTHFHLGPCGLECTPFGRTGGWFGLSTQGEELSG
jgi:hypothetical protein